MDEIIILSSRAQFEVTEGVEEITITPLTVASVVISILEKHYVVSSLSVNPDTGRVTMNRCINVIESTPAIMRRYPNADISSE